MKSSLQFVGALVGLACICAGVILSLESLVMAACRAALTVKAVAHQWWWVFDYPSLGIKTSDVLYLPSATNVRLELASADVIHSFWIAGMKDPINIFPGKTQPLDLISSRQASSTEIAIPVAAATPYVCGFACWRAAPTTSINGRLASVWSPRRSSQRAQVVPACALSTGHDGHAGHQSPSGHLQRLLDGDAATGNRPSS